MVPISLIQNEECLDLRSSHRIQMTVKWRMLGWAALVAGTEILEILVELWWGNPSEYVYLKILSYSRTILRWMLGGKVFDPVCTGAISVELWNSVSTLQNFVSRVVRERGGGGYSVVPKSVS